MLILFFPEINYRFEKIAFFDYQIWASPQSIMYRGPVNILQSGVRTSMVLDVRYVLAIKSDVTLHTVWTFIQCAMRGLIASAGARAYIRGFGGRAPSGVQGQSPVRESGDKAPWSWEPFSFWTSNDNDMCLSDCIWKSVSILFNIAPHVNINVDVG